MYQIIKLPGVNPDAMAVLHKFVKSDEVIRMGLGPYNKEDRLPGHKGVTFPLIHILSSRLDPEKETYTIELRVEMAIHIHLNPPGAHGILYPSFDLLKKIYSTIADYYPEKETIKKQ